MFPSELRAFHTVAQSGSIRKASEILNISPSSVSRRVALLEHEIGTALLDPTSATVGTRLGIEVRGTEHPATTVALPFYKRG